MEGNKNIVLDNKHILMPLAAVIALCGGLYWIGYSVATIRMEIGMVNQRMENIEEIVKENKSTSGELMKIINSHEQRITKLEAVQTE